MKHYKKTILFFCCVALCSCFKSQPTMFDGNASVTLYIKYGDEFLPSVPVVLKTGDYQISAFSDTTDTMGCVVFNDLPTAEYFIDVRSEVIIPSIDNPVFFDTLFVIGTGQISPENTDAIIDTVQTILSGTAPGLKINEIYYTGPPNDNYYYSDQYIELYNSSEDTMYLDGVVICRMGHYLDNVTYIFQFPGEALYGREYPVLPDSFVVIAKDAYDHRQVVSGSIDLVKADWEFCNSLQAGGYDNPDVPNIDNIETGHNLDFQMNLKSDVIILGDGSDVYYQDGIDGESVIDGVEYSAKSDHIKDIEDIIDRGQGGVGMLTYSNRSIERIAAGYDTNNSTLDFEIISEPTIGYQHK